jgi:hypothetical protein
MLPTLMIPTTCWSTRHAVVPTSREIVPAKPSSVIRFAFNQTSILSAPSAGHHSRRSMRSVLSIWPFLFLVSWTRRKGHDFLGQTSPPHLPDAQTVAYIGCGSTAYSVGLAMEEKDIYLKPQP